MFTARLAQQRVKLPGSGRRCRSSGACSRLKGVADESCVLTGRQAGQRAMLNSISEQPASSPRIKGVMGHMLATGRALRLADLTERSLQCLHLTRGACVGLFVDRYQ
jgi:hypothetical protein